MGDSPLPVQPSTRSSNVSQQLFADEASNASEPTGTRLFASPPRTRMSAVNGATRGPARQWAEQYRQPRSKATAAKEVSSSNSLASTLRSREDPAVTASGVTGIGAPSAASFASSPSALSPHLRTASEMELAQFAPSRSGESPVRAAEVARDSTGERALAQSEASSSPAGSASRRRVAQKYLHNRVATTTSTSNLDSPARSPGSSTRISRTNSLSLAGRSPRRSTYLDSSDTISEVDQDRVRRMQRIERDLEKDREHKGRNDIRREEADAIMAIMSSYQSFVDEYGIKLRTAVSPMASSRASMRSRTPPHTPKPWQRPNDGDTVQDGTEPPAGSMSGDQRSPHRATLTYDEEVSDSEGDPLAQAKLVESMSSLSHPELRTSSSRRSNPSSPLAAVRRSSSIEVERAQALIAEAKEMLSSSDVMRGSPRRDEEDADEADHWLDHTAAPAVSALASTMKPGANGGLWSHRASTQAANSPRSTAASYSPRTPRTGRTHAPAPPPPHTPSRVVEQHPRGYDPSIQYVVITYPSLYWVSQSRWFRFLVSTPVVLATKLILLCAGVWLLYGLFCVMRNTFSATLG